MSLMNSVYPMGDTHLQPAPDMDMVLEHQNGLVQIERLDDGRHRIRVRPQAASTYIHRASCDTAYPIDLIKQILELKGPEYLCDEISRDEDSLIYRSLICAQPCSPICPCPLSSANDFGFWVWIRRLNHDHGSLPACVHPNRRRRACRGISAHCARPRRLLPEDEC